MNLREISKEMIKRRLILNYKELSVNWLFRDDTYFNVQASNYGLGVEPLYNWWQKLSKTKGQQDLAKEVEKHFVNTVETRKLNFLNKRKKRNEI